MISSKSGRI